MITKYAKGLLRRIEKKEARKRVHLAYGSSDSYKKKWNKDDAPRYSGQWINVRSAGKSVGRGHY